jgi:hypothetical protein
MLPRAGTAEERHRAPSATRQRCPELVGRRLAQRDLKERLSQAEGADMTHRSYYASRVCVFRAGTLLPRCTQNEAMRRLAWRNRSCKSGRNLFGRRASASRHYWRAEAPALAPGCSLCASDEIANIGGRSRRRPRALSAGLARLYRESWASRTSPGGSLQNQCVAHSDRLVVEMQ